MDVSHSIAFLLIASLVQLPLIDVEKLTDELDLVVLDDLLDTILCVTHNVQELMVEDVSLRLLALLERVINVPGINCSFAFIFFYNGRNFMSKKKKYLRPFLAPGVLPLLIEALPSTTSSFMFNSILCLSEYSFS